MTTQRTILTEYHFQGNVVKRTTAANANRAVTACVSHMQINEYGAQVAEVWDKETSVLHAVIKCKVSGNIEITYKRDPTQFQPMRLAFGALNGGKK